MTAFRVLQLMKANWALAEKIVEGELDNIKAEAGEDVYNSIPMVRGTAEHAQDSRTDLQRCTAASEAWSKWCDSTLHVSMHLRYGTLLGILNDNICTHLTCFMSVP